MADDWIFIAHHKSGTTVGKALADVLCTAANRPIHKYTYRERPKTTTPPHSAHATGACHFLVKLYHEDAPMWLAHLAANPHSRLVHLVRDPLQMVASGYLFHRRGSEIEWTNSSRCSRDTCLLPPAWGAALSKQTSAPIFRAISAEGWLRRYGCRTADSRTPLTLYRCLLAAPSVGDGLEIEARRAHATLRTMIDFDEMIRGNSRALSLRLDQLARGRFNQTVVDLYGWLAGRRGLGAPPPPRLLDDAFRATFQSPRVRRMSTGVSQGASLDSAVLRSVKGWLRSGGTPALRELASRFQWPGHEEVPLFRRRAPTPPRAGSRGVVTCTSASTARSTWRMVLRLREAGCSLPVELWHAGGGEVARSVERLAAGAASVQARDLRSHLSTTRAALANDERVLLRGFACRPLALLATSLDEVLLVDRRAHFFADPTKLFGSPLFRASGMLLFHDRLSRHIRGQPLTDAARYVRHQYIRRATSAAFLGGLGLAWPWQPSLDMRTSPMLEESSSHTIDATALLFSKSRAPCVIHVLYALLDKQRHEMRRNLGHDKELFWLACELVGGAQRCGLSPRAASEIGAMQPQLDGRECLVGSLLQVDPHRPTHLSHCRGSPLRWTRSSHVATATLFRERAWQARTFAARDITLARALREATIARNISELRRLVRAGIDGYYFRRHCITRDANETLPAHLLVEPPRAAIQRQLEREQRKFRRRIARERAERELPVRVKTTAIDEMLDAEVRTGRLPE